MTDKEQEYISDALSGESACCGALLTPWDACMDCGEPSGQAEPSIVTRKKDCCDASIFPGNEHTAGCKKETK